MTTALLVLVALASAGETPPLQLVESWPVQTALDDPAVPEAHEVWPELIRGAGETLDIAQFYVVSEGEEPTRLDPVLDAVEEAAGRGVRVRLLADARFALTYPDQLDRLDAVEGIEVRRYDMDPLTGGVMHAKYFVVDGEAAFVGSQNWDWRSLEHIQELGVVLAEPAAVRDVARVFSMDWELAGQAAPVRPDPVVRPEPDPLDTTYGGDPARMLVVASPRDLLPAGVAWDLPRLVSLIDQSDQQVRVQLLSYATLTFGGDYWDELDRALRRAEARGVRVQLLVSDWAKKPPKVAAIQSLAVLPGLEARFLDIPEHDSGHIPYARTAHAKLLTVDGQAAWVGTANWSGDYFLASRNLGVVVESAAFTADLDRWFERGWSSSHAEPVDPGAEYRAPRIGD